jgi:D-glycero-D-manno-heptose 1,7-bisphosphate phosphatase
MTTSPTEVGSDGIWRQVLRPETTGRPALFLDRDGTIVEEVHYLHRPADVRLEQGAGATIRAANTAGLAVVVVTNQAGIGRGYYGWNEFAAVQRRLIELLAAENARLDMVLACPFHEEARGAFRVADHPARKPNAGMLQDAARALRIDLPSSLMVGDRASDIAAGRNAGLRRALLVQTGYGARENGAVAGLSTSAFSVEIVANLGEVGAKLAG